MATGLHDVDGALEIFNYAIRLLEAEERLSNNANDTLERLRTARDRVAGKSDDISSIQIVLQAMSDDQLNHIIDKIAEGEGEERASYVQLLKQMDRNSRIDILSQILQ